MRQDIHEPRLSSAASFVKRLHDLAGECHCNTVLKKNWLWADSKLLLVAVQRKGYMDLKQVAFEDSMSCCYGLTLDKDPNCTLDCSWAEADPSTFLIRGDDYLVNHQKVSFQFLPLFGKNNKKFLNSNRLAYGLDMALIDQFGMSKVMHDLGEFILHIWIKFTYIFSLIWINENVLTLFDEALKISECVCSSLLWLIPKREFQHINMYLFVF